MFNFNEEDLVINGWDSKRTTWTRLRIPKGVQVIHLPTGTKVEVDDQRSQHKNRQKALNILDKKLEEKNER